MAREKIEVGIDQFLMELQRLLGPESKKVQAGLGFEGVVLPVELANWIVTSCEKFLEREDGEPSPEFELTPPQS